MLWRVFDVLIQPDDRKACLPAWQSCEYVITQSVQRHRPCSLRERWNRIYAGTAHSFWFRSSTLLCNWTGTQVTAINRTVFFYQSHNKLKSSSSATVFVILVILYYHRGSFSPVTFVYEISLPVGECSITPPPLELIQLIHFNCTYLSWSSADWLYGNQPGGEYAPRFIPSVPPRKPAHRAAWISTPALQRFYLRITHERPVIICSFSSAVNLAMSPTQTRSLLVKFIFEKRLCKTKKSAAR